MPAALQFAVHKIAKLLLEKAGSFEDRQEAVKRAVDLGMPLNQIQEYLDWLDSVAPTQPRSDQPLPPDIDSAEKPSK